MELVVAAKSTKPGSKATAKRSAMANGKPPRVPVGTLHIVDRDAQTTSSAMFDAVCGEGALVCVDYQWEDDLPNDRCDACGNQLWMVSFNSLQEDLLR